MRMFHVKASYSGALCGGGISEHRKDDEVGLPRAISAVVPTKERVGEVLGAYFQAMADAVDCGWHPNGLTCMVSAVEVDEQPQPARGA